MPTKVPDPYARREFRGRLLDNATVAALMLVEHKLGYELTITQGVGGAAASAGTHLGLNGEGGRAVDLAWWDQQRKMRAMRATGCFAYWPRPELPGEWPDHGHGVLVFKTRTNKRGVAPSAFRQIGSYDRGRNGLKDDGADAYPYRPKPLPVFTLEQYRHIITGGLEAPPVTKVTRMRDAMVEAIHDLSTAIALGKQVHEGRVVIDKTVEDLIEHRRELRDRLEAMPKR